jgi:hypothetical protein
MADIYEKPHGLKRTLAVSLALFVVAAGFFYLAYVGLVTGTAVKTADQFRKPARGLPPALGYDGVYDRQDNPGQFWFMELLYTAPTLFFTGSGMGNLWLEYKRRQHQKEISSLPHGPQKRL